MSGFNMYLDEKIMEMYRQERLEEAETARLLRQIQAQQTKGNGWLARFFIWLGRQMVHWGARLQGYYLPPAQMAPEPHGLLDS